MKKFYLAFAAILLAFGATFAQPVSDHAVIPIGITLHSILRLEVTNGGNIEFAFTSIEDYTTGLGPNAIYETDFRVTSSTGYNVGIFGDADPIAGSIVPTNTIDLDHVGYTCTGGPAAVAGYKNLTNTAVNCVAGGTAGKGTLAANQFNIAWQCATVTTAGGPFILVNPKPDRYVVNVLLEAVAL